MTITEACSTFLDDELRFRNCGRGTIQGYETIFRSLLRWATKSGVSSLEDLDDRAIRKWIKEWTCRPSTTRQRLTQIKKFFLFAVERGWVPRSPLATVRPPRSDSAPTMPLTVREMWALLKACGRRPKERGLILLMRYSGLAIGDAVTLSREAVIGTELTLRRAKTGELVMVDLPHIVVRAIRSIRGPNPDYFWWSGKGQRVTSAKRWRTRLREVAARAGVEGFYPHRLRDTFRGGVADGRRFHRGCKFAAWAQFHPDDGASLRTVGQAPARPPHAGRARREPAGPPAGGTGSTERWRGRWRRSSP